MNRFFTLLFAASSLTSVGQVTYPYNPDGNADALIGVTDLQDLLSTYGGAFSPSEVQIDGVGLGEVLTGLYAMIDSMQAALTVNQSPFPLIQQMNIINCGHILECAIECPVIYEWNPPTVESSIDNCDRPTWVRYEVVADWFDQVDSCRFMNSYKAPSSQYGTPASFGFQGLSASGIGTDTLRFTFYNKASNLPSPWSELADVPSDLIPEAVWVVTPFIYGGVANRYHLELSVLIEGVWYNTNIFPFR